jgi:hypothetical protein
VTIHTFDDPRPLASLVMLVWLGLLARRLREAGRGWWLSPSLPAALAVGCFLVLIWLA